MLTVNVWRCDPEIAMQHSPTQTGGMSVHGECAHEQLSVWVRMCVCVHACVCTRAGYMFTCANVCPPVSPRSMSPTPKV
jgi:hypothetical protein